MTTDLSKPNEGRPRQWTLYHLLVLIAAVALFLGFLTNLPVGESLELDFKNLPQEDAKLKSWLQDEFHASEISLDREDRTLRVRFSRPFSASGITSPPWTELGYPEPKIRIYSRNSRLHVFFFAMLAASTLVLYLLALRSLWRLVTSKVPPNANGTQRLSWRKPR